MKNPQLTASQSVLLITLISEVILSSFLYITNHPIAPDTKVTTCVYLVIFVVSFPPLLLLLVKYCSQSKECNGQEQFFLIIFKSLRVDNSCRKLLQRAWSYTKTWSN